MAIIKCSECGKEISEKAKVCPYCGAKTTNAEKEEAELALAIIFAVLALIGGGIAIYALVVRNEGMLLVAAFFAGVALLMQLLLKKKIKK